MAVRSLFILALSFLLLCTDATTYRGHWEKTWSVPSTSSSDANLGFAFSGYSTSSSALSESAGVYSILKGIKIITLGGGNANGRWSHAALQDVNAAIDSGSFRDYNGIAFDVEEGDSGLSSAFLATFSKAKQAGYLVVVTVSHTSPYGVPDASDLIWAFINSHDIHIISPMMYASGTQFQDCSQSAHVDTSISNDVPWWWFHYSKAAVVPSIWSPHHYATASNFLKSQSVTTSGYIAWCA